MGLKSKQQRLEQLKSDLWYQNFRGVTTMSGCFNKCGNGARGGRECADCVEKELAELVGADLAKLYHYDIVRIRDTESAMDAAIES